MLEEKARENLEAATRLAGDESGDNDYLPNAAASRAYYAAYLAVAHRAQARGRGFTAEATDYYRHDRLPEDAWRWGILDEDGREVLEWLRNMRIKADYHEDNVDFDEASEAIEQAAVLLERLLAEAPRDGGLS